MRADDLTTASAPEAGRWEFDESVADAFDDMLRRSIPNLDDMRRFVTDATVFLARRSTMHEPLVLDLGASRGSALRPIVDRLGAHATYAACDVSAPMLEACRREFQGYIDARRLNVFEYDLRNGYPAHVGPAAVVLSILTLQFVPIEYRQRLLGQVHRALVPGGGFLLVEKVLGSTWEADSLMTALYHDTKRHAGYSDEAIERKAAALEGVLVPLTARFNEELLRSAGFPDPEQAWAWGPFRGWLAVKR